MLGVKEGILAANTRLGVKDGTVAASTRLGIKEKTLENTWLSIEP
jgi:hypothetical protein